VNKAATQPKRRLEKLNKSAENKGTTKINYGCIRKQTKNNNKRGNGKRGKNPKLMVQQPAREAMKKNKKRVQQLVGKEIHRPKIDKAKEKAFGCKLKKNKAFSVSNHTKYRGQLLHKVQNLISN
jgi:hypothetical protein